MKNLKKLLSGTALVVLLSLSMTLFTSNTAQAQANAGGVEIIKNGGFYLIACDGEVYPEQSSTFQKMNEGPHMATIVFNLPEDCCLIKDRAYTMYFPNSEEGPFKLKVTPSGMAIAKFLNN